MPKFRNRTPYCADLFPLIDRDGHNVAVVIAKATFDIPLSEDEPWTVTGAQDPLLLVDEYVGEPGRSDVRVPADLADFKPATEVLIIPPADPERRAPRGSVILLEVGPVRVAKSVGTQWPFGPVRRDQEPRKSLAGTYDEAWVRERMPLLPTNFDPRYHLAAPPDQIAPGYLAGDEPFLLERLYGDRTTVRGFLPGKGVVVSGNVRAHYFTELARLDTVIFWSDAPKATLVWRHVIRPKNKLEEVRNVYADPIRLATARQLYGTA